MNRIEYTGLESNCGLFSFTKKCMHHGIDVLFQGIIRKQQSGAVEARWAHNPEVRGSKPRSAILILL